MMTNHRNFLNHPDYIQLYNETVISTCDNIAASLVKENYTYDEIISLLNNIKEVCHYEYNEH